MTIKWEPASEEEMKARQGKGSGKKSSSKKRDEDVQDGD